MELTTLYRPVGPDELILIENPAGNGFHPGDRINLFFTRL